MTFAGVGQKSGMNLFAKPLQQIVIDANRDPRLSCRRLNRPLPTIDDTSSALKWESP